MKSVILVAMPLHDAGAKEHSMMHHVLHSAAARLARGLIGTVVFVQASQHATFAGVLALALGSVLIISAGPDVAPGPVDAVTNT